MSSLKVTMKLKGLDSFLKENTDPLDRFLNWKPIENDIHDIMLEHHKKVYSTKRGRVGQMRRLGPSVINKSHADHVWIMGTQAFEFGTKVWYTHLYDATMKEHHRKRSHVQMPAKVRKQVMDRISLWFLEGR